MAVAFLLYVIAEIAAIWAVGSAVGVLGTLGLLLAGAFLGSWLARREGAKAMRAFAAAARSGRPAEKELTDGMLVGLGGVLILVPGFVSDVLGLLLILPPSRAVARRWWLRRMKKRAVRFANRRRGPVMAMDSEVVSEPRRPDQPTVIEGRIVEN
ncbi:FxsA family protein [Amycolatopsis vancoresmycina]|uniref:FxsA cytoplasmic membrane protein n=1 Tax=Amycolatopsis vancoresmycina DSM 44592 TaxID=1292037 RepID=R1GFK6_9PSEU|nr:FxsA family protein [Amycolatopsis vancoresmycina]EOD69973.1 FxsA cytoplasmic membrane protein [Amycolatopsis vancoresmycina DSM 44592]